MNPYPVLWACSVCHLEYGDRRQAVKCCTSGHEKGWNV